MRRRLALAIAAIADAIQLGLPFLFIGGVLEIPDDVLDGIVALLLIVTLGFRWRLVFALFAELTPGLALFPSWTMVVLSIPTAPAAPNVAVAEVGAPKLPVGEPPAK